MSRVTGPGRHSSVRIGVLVKDSKRLQECSNVANDFSTCSERLGGVRENVSLNQIQVPVNRHQ